MCVDMCIYVHTGYIVSYSVKLHDLRAYVLVMPACDYPATSVELLAGRFSKLQSTWIERKNPTSFFPSGLGRSSASNPKHVWVRDPRQVRGPEPLPAAWRAQRIRCTSSVHGASSSSSSLPGRCSRSFVSKKIHGFGMLLGGYEYIGEQKRFLAVF